MRRDRMEIWLDILAAVQQVTEDTPPSRIQAKANLPHGRFWRHVHELVERGLLEGEPLRATDEGTRLLSETHSLRDLLSAREER